MNPLQEALEEIVVVHKLDEASIARLLGASPSTIRRWRAGATRPVGLAEEQTIAILNAYGDPASRVTNVSENP